MGDLSIVIEDESNMINLWDFAGNPAGFLEDEKGSVIRGDFIWNTYQIKNLPYNNQNHIRIFNFKANGNIFDNDVSLEFRKESNFAIGLGGDYFSRQTDADYDDQKLKYPNLVSVFSKSITSKTIAGVSLRYLNYNFDFSRRYYDWNNSETEYSKETIEGFQTQLGLIGELIPGAISGLALGFERIKLNWEYGHWYYSSDDVPQPDHYYVYPYEHGISKTGWLSLQTLVEIERKFKLGMECTLQLMENETNYHQPDSRFCLRLRGAYDVSSRLRLGILFSDANSEFEIYDPVYSYVSSLRHETFTNEWGAGFSFSLFKELLTGFEYHFQRFPQPNQTSEPFRLRIHSWNVGLEGNISNTVLLRGGYIGSKIDHKPNYDQKDSWENIITAGLGLQSLESDLTFELSYRYAFKKYKDWYGNWDVESDARTFSFSFKKGL